MPAIMAKKKTKDEQVADRHKHQVLSLRPPPGMREVLKRIADKERRSMAQVALIYLEKALAEAGLWPPPPAG